MLFRKFQEENLDPHINVNQEAARLDEEYTDLFRFQRIDVDIKKTDQYLKLKKNQAHQVAMASLQNKDAARPGTERMELESQKTSLTPFDIIFTQFIFIDKTNVEVRKRALKVLISNFSQRDTLMKELARTDIIVSPQDYRTYINFLSKQRQLKQLTLKLIQDEMFHMIYKKSPGTETKNTKSDIIHILAAMSKDIEKADVIEKKRLQNMLRHIGLVSDILNVLLKRLIYKELSYRDLFQTCVDFFYHCCYDNPSCQLIFLPELNFFLDMLNKQIHTGSLIQEILKSNKDAKYSQSFAKYLIRKIVDEGYFKSNLIDQLIKLAESNMQQSEELDDNIFLRTAAEDKIEENPNQQFILKQIIKSPRFRSLLLMRRSLTTKKLGIIKTYVKKREQYNISKKEVDEALLIEKENLDLHLSIIDLVAACARNSPFCIAQAQKLIECNELLDSILSDAIPFIVKRHYFVLLYEVYLRKVPGPDEGHRLPVNDVKLNQVMQWVVLYDLENSFHHYAGLVNDAQPDDTPEVERKLRQVHREITRASEAEYEDKNATATDKDKVDARKFKAQLSSFKDTNAYYLLDTNDKSEYWRYLFEQNYTDNNPKGMLCFIENFYRDYSVKDLDDENMAAITVKIRDRLLQLTNKIFTFVDQHESHIKPYVHDFLKQANRAIQRIPHLRAFRVGKKRVLKDGKLIEIADNDIENSDQSLNMDESREVDNRMSGDKVLRILRDYIIKENIHIKDAFGINNITTDNMVSREVLKDAIKKITGSAASYDDIMKALDYFRSVSLEKKQERQVMNVEPGQPGYVMSRNEGQMNIEQEIRSNKINFKDVELQLKDVLKKAGYKAPNQQRVKGGEEHEKLEPTIAEDEFSVAINMDLKLFVQRFYEHVHITKNFAEIHDYVHKLMTSEFVKDRRAKVQLINNLLKGFTGLSGDNDEIVLTSILNLILKRFIPDEDSSPKHLVERKIKQRKLTLQLQDLLEWQNVMFECKVPEFLLGMVNSQTRNDFLSNKCLSLLNNIMSHSTDSNQQRMLEVLKRENLFFPVFLYLKKRLVESKNFTVAKVKEGARKKFIDLHIKTERGKGTVKPNDFKSQKIYLDLKFDVEQKYAMVREAWRDDEINVLLLFLNSLCENCFRPAQLFVRQQILDDEVPGAATGKITSVDLVYVVANVFVEIVGELGDYVFSDYRTYKLIPILLDTLNEFIYGPCIENQIFLGGWKKLILTMNSLIDQRNFGNYAGIHSEAKSQLAMLHSVSSVLLAICDIKDEQQARRTHELIINEMNIDNLILKMVEIYCYKIGGSPEKRRIYDFQITCSHYDSQLTQSLSKCIENEFCETGFLIPRDIRTIETGFQIYMIL
jgi:hypothetical protein